MNNAQLIPTGGEQGVVTFSLRVEGKILPLTVPIYGLTVSKEVNRIPYARLLIDDGDPAVQDFEISNEPWFVPGNAIEIFLGQLNDENRIFKGVIIKQQLSIRQGSSLLEVDCRDAAYRMTLHRQGRYFEDLTDSELASELLSPYGLGTQITQTSYRHTSFVQYDCTDWDFLVTRMENNGLLVMIDDGVAHIQAPDFGQEPALHLHYGATVIEFDGGLEVRDQSEEVIARGWDPGNQTIVEVAAQEPEIKQNGNLPGKKIAPANGTAPKVWRHGGHIKDEELQAWADARLLKDRLSRTCGRVLFQGYNIIKPGQIVILQGFGHRFNGPVFVSAVHQEYLESGWLTEIEFGLSPKWFPEIVKMEAPLAAGMLPAVSGLQVGLVTQIEDEREDGSRVRVRLPILDTEASGVWARVATLDAGDNRGTFFRPEVNDEVIVGFIQDDPRTAVILGMLHSSSKPPPFEVSAQNHEKGYVSREGIRLVFHEEDGSITLETPGGNQLILSDEGGGLVLSDQNGNVIEMSSNGITLKSKKNVGIEAGTTYSVQSEGVCSIESSSSATLQANGVTTIKGGLVKIN